MKRQMDHRGLSLIELIVSIAILSIVVGAIFGFRIGRRILYP